MVETGSTFRRVASRRFLILLLSGLVPSSLPSAEEPSVPDGLPIFLDSFEVGDVCDWSAAVPSFDQPWHLDFDVDSFGDPAEETIACRAPDDHVDNPDDCDDDSAATFPGAAPLDLPLGCLRDVDGDDFGSDSPPIGVPVGSDCDDLVSAINTAATEICNLVDDDCDTVVDEGFDVDGDLFTSCGGDCDDGDPAVNPDAADPIDGQFLDQNCDGSDGDLETAVFVSNTGSDVSNLVCSLNQPCRTVNYAQAVAGVLGRDEVYLQAGTYIGVVVLLDGLTLVGGFDLQWVRADRNQAGHGVTLSGGFDATVGTYSTLRANTVVATLADLFVEGPDTPASPSTTAHSTQAVWSSSSNLTFDRVTFQAGAAQLGADGSNGTAASQTPPDAGMNGAFADDDPVICSNERPPGGPGASNPSCSTGTGGGSGGAGGSKDTSCNGTFGTCDVCAARPGLAGAPVGQGGAGGGVCGGTPGTGTPGLAVHGSAGQGALGGELVSNRWRGKSGSSGLLGQHGQGGGGGGGAGGCETGFDSSGAGGGGGGAGGCRASVAGGGGFGGGGSFGIFAVNSTLVVRNSLFERGIGGIGGDGGTGAAGQPGGSAGQGGADTPTTVDGGDGGAGATGGHSSGGGGGAGGRCAGILTLNSAVTTQANSFTGGTGGTGGSGGDSPGSDGTSGSNGSLQTVATCASAASC